MDAVETESLIARGQSALASAGWTEARHYFEAALRSDPDSPEALEGLGMAAWWLRDPPTVFKARERAYRLYLERNDPRSAARVAIALAEDFRSFRGELAVARGWHRRARRLLEPLPRSSEHGWLKVIEGDFAIVEDHDPVLAARFAGEASEIGRAIGDTEIQILGLALEGLALVGQGRIDAGMPCLDEAVAAATAGELDDPYAIGACFCYLIAACAQVRDFERANQWCDRAKEYAHDVGFDLLYAACRVQHAEVLIWQGAWDDAELELERALGQAVHYPAIAAEGTARLADLRRRQGRHDEAERLLETAYARPYALLIRAQLDLDRDDPRSAARHAGRLLRRIPATNYAERLGALAVMLRACIGASDESRAGKALEELRTLVAQLGTDVACADGAFAEGLYHAASGLDEAARSAFEDALDLYARCGVPLEAARARLELAGLLHRSGDHEAAEREYETACAAFRRLGASAELVRATERFAGLNRAPSGRAGPLSRRELDVLRQVAEGRTNAEIAARLHLSEHTVKRHIANILTKLDLPSRAAAAAHAVRSGFL